MRQQVIRRWWLNLLMVGVALAVGACGGSGKPPEPSAAGPAMDGSTGADSVAQILEAPAPRDVDPELWRQLTTELAHQVARYGRDKAAATPPTGEINAIRDLHIVPGTTNLQLAWTHLSIGDYDRNGEVNINDLTPVGIHYGATPAAWGWDAAQSADGDVNGEVNIGDITPIGQNYRVRTTVYNVYGSVSLSDYPDTPDAPNGSGTRIIGSVDINDFTAVPAGRELTIEITAPLPGEVFWVRPSDGATDGAASNYTAALLRGDWWMEGREPLHQGRSPANGPRDSSVAWTFTATTAGPFEGSPVIRGDGIAYIGCQDGRLYAVRPDGTEEWSYAADDSILGTPAIGFYGVVFCGSQDHHLYAINPGGTLRWRLELSSDVYSPTIGPDGTIYVGTNHGEVLAVDPTGTIDWTFITSNAVQGSPALDPAGVIYVANYAGELYAINPDGSERWLYTAPDAIFRSPSIGADGTVYFGCSDNYIYALTPAGTERWRYLDFRAVECGLALGVDGAIYAGGRSGMLTALEPDGSLRWRYNGGWMTFTAPVIGADGMVYYADSGGHVTAVNPDGNLHWRSQVSTDSLRGLTLGPDGTLFAAGDLGELYALSGGSGGSGAGVEGVNPVDGLTGATLTPVVIPSGTPPFTYHWDFGGGATPNTSTEESPAVVLGEPGIYPANVTVTNSYGSPSTYNFDLYSYPAPPDPAGWVHSLGSAQGDSFDTAAVAPDGSIYAAGYSAAATSPNCRLLIAHYAASGELMDAFTYETISFSTINALAIGPSGEINCAGVRNDGSDNVDVIVLRFAPDHSILLQQAWDSGGYDRCEAIMPTAGGGFTVAGAATSSHGEDFLTLSWNAAGAFSGGWQYDVADESAYAIASDGSDILLAGLVRGSGEGEADALLLKLNADATVAWAKTYGTPQFEATYALQVDSAGTVYAAGSAGLVCSFSPAGALNWARSWCGARPQVFSCLALDGTTLYAGGDDWTSDFGDDLVAARGDTSGAVLQSYLWQAAYADDFCEACTLTPSGSLVLAGGGAHAYGIWRELNPTAQAFPGTLHDVTPTRTAVTIVPVDLTGEVSEFTGVQDTGGGGGDALVFNWDFSE